MFEKLESIEKRYEELSGLLSDPKIIAQQNEYQKYAKESSDLAPIIKSLLELKKT